ncbi:hypothetical protein [Larkinella rosea]|uniref:Uncharacterized protein n=1 Tax=Larkinella rosea TaxID=2025312 RepID=A0A3P1C1R5_9BACT|nr:hypothetical protein [Larkinella rosea]RRB07198.1 hypothetical protein EHT25_05290 [Larkinella rosea]
MNTKVKLIQSALGLAIGMWMLACGGPGDGVNKLAQPKAKAPTKGKQAILNQSSKNLKANGLIVTTSEEVAFERISKKGVADQWYIESYK